LSSADLHSAGSTPADLTRDGLNPDARPAVGPNGLPDELPGSTAADETLVELLVPYRASADAVLIAPAVAHS
jgi:hypothetical protein